MNGLRPRFASFAFIIAGPWGAAAIPTPGAMPVFGGGISSRAWA